MRFIVVCFEARTSPQPCFAFWVLELWSYFFVFCVTHVPSNYFSFWGLILVVLCFMCLWLADGRCLTFSSCCLKFIHPLSLSYYVLDHCCKFALSLWQIWKLKMMPWYYGLLQSIAMLIVEITLCWCAAHVCRHVYVLSFLSPQSSFTVFTKIIGLSFFFFRHVFMYSWRLDITFVMSVQLSVRPRVLSKHPVDGF